MSIRRRALLIVTILLAAPSRLLAGAWSHGTFANDGALDWTADFQKNPTAGFVRKTLNQGTSAQDIETYAGQSIIAAAEVVAASLGRPSPELPEELAPLVARSRSELRALASLARSALGEVLGPKSELRESWSLHAEGLARWQGSINQLLARLSSRVA